MPIASVALMMLKRQYKMLCGCYIEESRRFEPSPHSQRGSSKSFAASAFVERVSVVTLLNGTAVKFPQITSNTGSDEDLRIDLTRAITNLPQAYREILILRDVSGFS